MKIADVSPKIKDLEVLDFIDNTQVLLNNGLYEMRVFDAIPAFAANDGEAGIYVSGSVRALYFSLGSIWSSIGFNSSGTLVLFDNDYDTGITPEATVDEDVIRFYVAGLYKFAMGTFGFAVDKNTPVVFDATDGTNKWMYDSATTYLTCYQGGNKRLEL